MYKFEIESMSCMGCVRHIQDALKILDKAVTIKTDLQSHKMEVSTSLIRHEVKAAINEAGYEVKDLN